MKQFRSFRAVLALGLAAAPLMARAAEDPTEFFEKKIRPMLVEKCYECHGSEKQKGGLRLDTKAGWEKGGDTGPAIVPGNPDKSLLIQAVRYHDDDLAMPPKKNGGKMPDEQIADLEAWVKVGAPDPRVGGPASPARDMEGAKQHWAFKPVVKPEVPAVKDAAWVKTPVDNFILAQLEAKGLKPAPAADKRTLLRRVYFDLTGLPPSEPEVEDFLNDSAPNAYEKVVDRLLASPHYGERYGRYWLDVARYADTRGYLAGGEERRFPFSHTYRDYVISSFTKDKPYDQFIMEQIAADRMVSGEDQSALAALGFLTLGRAGTYQEIVDDRIDVVCRGLMALTVACARCHDHKFDPVPTADYYSLYSIFANSEEPQDKPLLSTKPNSGPQYDDYLAKRAEVQKRIDAKEEEMLQAFVDQERRKLGDYLLAVQDAGKQGAQLKLDTFAGERKLVTPVLERWRTLVAEKQKAPDAILAPWFAFLALPEAEFAAKAKDLAAQIAANADPAKPVNPVVAKAFAGLAPTSLKDVAAVYNKLGVQLADAWKAANDKAAKEKQPAPTSLANADEEAIRAAYQANNAPTELPRADQIKVIQRKFREGTVKLRKEMGELDWSHPGAPLRAMAMVDKAKPGGQRIFVRGNPGNLGNPVPRQFLEVLSPPERKPFTEGSGRLELARSIVSKDNPLTARTFVNRFWGWHFGSPFVRTPGDFGVRTSAPTQVALLDYLSARFMEEGWSVKKLHKLVLLSSTYQQSSDLDPKADLADPTNELVHRYNRHRLDFEAMRDSLLSCAGRLDLTVGGLPVEISKEPFATRRTVYGFIDRLNLPAVFQTFDFANPNISTPQRFVTTVPQQALFMLNSSFVVEQARALVRRPEVQNTTSDADRLEALYGVLYQRTPDDDEVKEAEAFLKRQQARAAQPTMEPGWQYGMGWYDPLVNNTKDFRLMKFIEKMRRTPDKVFPSKDFQHLMFVPNGGHPGPTQQLATVLRWVSPVDGKVKVEGLLEHKQAAGDGVRGRIVSGRGGLLGEWLVHNGSSATNIDSIEAKMGETIDFVVDCREGGPNSDGYNWAPRVTLVGDYPVAVAKRGWDAQKDFAPTRKLTPLTAWESLAQAMLVSNEMMFVD